jgi:hypothetical protein
MPSLSEAYDQHRRGGPERDPRLVALGVVLSGAGAAALLTGLLVPTTPLAGALGATTTIEMQKLVGLLVGLAAPAVMLGVVTVLPSRRRVLLGAGLGTVLCLGGVALFWHAYPAHWTLAEQSLAFETGMVYVAGAFVSLLSVFTAMARFKRRNNPHGTVRMEVTKQGETTTVELSRREFREYQRTMSDGGSTEEVIRELEDRADD